MAIALLGDRHKCNGRRLLVSDGQKNDTAGTETSTALSTLKKNHIFKWKYGINHYKWDCQLHTTEPDKMHFASTATGISNITDIDNSGALSVFHKWVKMAEYARVHLLPTLILATRLKAYIYRKVTGRQ